MQIPLEIIFENMQPSEELRDEVERQVQRLESFFPRIVGCRVVVHAPESRHRHGEAFRIGIRVILPRHKDVVVGRLHGDVQENQHPLVAIRNAFELAQRQIEDAAREMRGQTKLHVAPQTGRVSKFLAGEDSGFIETTDGREIYFHRHSVLNGAFDRMVVGTKVRFVEEEGERGSQASTVAAIGKHWPG